MRTVTIPAQITTVEDRIAAGLTIIQLEILIIGISICSLLFACTPPTFHGKWYKTFLILFVFSVSSILSVRIKGKIVLEWIRLLSIFHTRSSLYVFDKSDHSFREKIRKQSIKT